MTSSVDGALGSFLPGGGAFGRSGVASSAPASTAAVKSVRSRFTGPARLDAALSEKSHERANRGRGDFVDVLVTKLIEKTLAEDALVPLPSARPKFRSEQRLESVVDEGA